VNVILLEPCFTVNQQQFARALAETGATVRAVGGCHNGRSGVETRGA